MCESFLVNCMIYSWYDVEIISGKLYDLFLIWCKNHFWEIVGFIPDMMWESFLVNCMIYTWYDVGIFSGKLYDFYLIWCENLFW